MNRWQSCRVGSTQYYTAATLDGYIADEQAVTSWVSSPTRGCWTRSWSVSLRLVEVAQDGQFARLRYRVG